MVALVTDIKWKFSLAAARDRIACGPQYTLLTDKYHVTVYKSRDAKAYEIVIIEIRTGKRLYESRFDKFYQPTIDAREAREQAILKLSRFSL